MTQAADTNRLSRPVTAGTDHVLGPPDAPITLVEYGSYACPYCRGANEEVVKLRDRFGARLRYVFRHRPLPGNDLAFRAAEIAEHAENDEQFWGAHVELMTRSPALTQGDLDVVAEALRVPAAGEQAAGRARARVVADDESAVASGVVMTPTFFINGRRYDGPWDETSLGEAMLGSLGHRVHSAAVDFASWAPSTGVLLLLASIAAVILTNSPLGADFEALWRDSLGIVLGGAMFELSLRAWLNDGLLTLFFLVVGLEVKRELTVGRLAGRRSAALPIAAAIGGMVVPPIAYLAIVPSGQWTLGAGVPMPTDTAFAVALIVMLRERVPVELRVFLTAASIVDDIGTILVVALFYSSSLHAAYLLLAAAVFAALVLLNRSGVYRALPYGLLGLALWACVHAGGLHATLAGVLLAMVIPTRRPPNLSALLAQAQSVITAESRRGEQVLRHGPSVPALRALDAIHDRVESPADRLLRSVEPWSSYVVLPLFALANAGLVVHADVFSGREPLALGILAGLVVGKPLGFLLASLAAVRLGLADKPAAYTWSQVAAAGALAGIGFTMSLFIAGQAFPDEADFAASKLAVFGASTLSAIIGVAILWRCGRAANTAASLAPSHPSRSAQRSP
ncbi:MAG TPA: Na+/H+ antiporter NhaA [Burkholderiales bacterium]|nr:Na+/H+ antiporter NhaA [Burkholderiales bacterium]